MDDRDRVFQKQSLSTLDGPVHLLSPTSASPPLQELTQLTNYARDYNGLWLQRLVLQESYNE